MLNVARKQKAFIVPGADHFQALNQLLETGWYVKQVVPAAGATFWFVVAEELGGAAKTSAESEAASAPR